MYCHVSSYPATKFTGYSDTHMHIQTCKHTLCVHPHTHKCCTTIVVMHIAVFSQATLAVCNKLHITNSRLYNIDS